MRQIVAILVATTFGFGIGISSVKYAHSQVSQLEQTPITGPEQFAHKAGVREILNDDEGSGAFQWVLSCWRDHPWRLSYTLTGALMDNTLQQATISFGLDSPGMYVGVYDSHGDKSHQWFALPSRSPREKSSFSWIYTDLDSDGRIDLSLNVRSNTHFILYGASWIEVESFPDEGSLISCIVMFRGEAAEARFVGGEWRIVGVQLDEGIQDDRQ